MGDRPELIRAVIETPRGSRNKYSYEPELGALLLKKTLPEGLAFPFDFGFIPQTRGEDGDAVDIMVLGDAPSAPGCVVEARVIGRILALQKGRGPALRNDRYLGVAQSSVEFADCFTLKDLPPHIAPHIVKFFETYNELEGRPFVVQRMQGARAALRSLKKRISPPAPAGADAIPFKSAPPFARS